MSESCENKKRNFEVALATRNFEIELFWKRSIFFWGFIASSFVGYASLIKSSSNLAVVIACFGFVCSLAWTLVNRGSKRWQENWEIIIDNMDDDITGGIFKLKELKTDSNFWLSARKFSVSKITIALSDFTVIIWASLLLFHLCKLCLTVKVVSINALPILAILLTFAFVLFMFNQSKSSD